MFCANCGKENQSSARFCFNCGAALIPPAAPVAPAAPAPVFPTPDDPSNATVISAKPAYPVQTPAAYPPAYPPVYPPVNAYPVQPAAKSGGSGILARLPVIGALLAAAGFFLAWETESGDSGLNVFSKALEVFGSFGAVDLSDIYAAQQLLIVVLMIGVVLVLAAALMGLLTLTGSRASRVFTVIVSVLALIDVLGLYGFVIWERGSIEDVLPFIGIGWILVVAGLLWMIITPLFARKS